MRPSGILIRSAVIAALGGLLFGFDTAVISGTTAWLKSGFVSEIAAKVYPLLPSISKESVLGFMLGFTVAGALIGTILGSIGVGKPTDAVGRRGILFALAALYFVSAVGCGLAWGWWSFMIFRFIGGLAVGGASVVSPMYIAEISPARYRGRLVAFTQFNIVLGILLAYLSNYVIGNLHLGTNECRWMFGVMAAPSAVFFVLLFLTPESPRWLLAKGRVEEARCRAGVRRTHPTTHVPRCLPQGAIIMKSAFAMLTVIVVLTWISTVAQAASPDIVLADFEGQDYGDWKTTGEAFGPGPAQGTLPHQMEVSGYLGHGLVNSFYGGDKSTGTLTSPAFTINRTFIRFLIGGGGWEGKTCINLLVDGKVVRTATGPNTKPGGSEALEPCSWDVGEFAGKKAQIQIVDNATGGWGHINIDHIVQSDRKAELLLRDQKREIVLQKQFLNLPVKNGAPKRRMQMLVDGKPVRIFDIELASAEPDFWAFTDLSLYKGKTATLLVDRLPESSRGLAAIEQADQIRDADTVYKEKLRPQFHYTQKRGWNNDPNGLVHYKGEWHLFYQHNPYGCGWANMHWGHAVSRDLVHWQELPIALYPWTMAKEHCFSGSAAVDWNNTAGFQTGEEKVLVAAFTDTGCGESIAYSNDRGRTWTCWRGNPVVKHSGRDPKIFWYAPGKHWVMAMYDSRPPYGDNIGIATSTDLKHWAYQSHIPGFFECPEIFELPVDGDKNNTRWVVYAADAKYVIGRFDGKVFTPEHQGKHQVHWGNYYASQTFNDPPDGRKIQIGWGRIDMPGMPFNQMMTFPCELTLRTTSDGIRMFAQPIPEIETLDARSHVRRDVALTADKPLSVPVAGDLFDIRAEFQVGPAKAFGLTIGGRKIVYDAGRKTLEGMPLLPVDGKIQIQLLVDRPSLEICGNQGRVYQTCEFRAAGPIQAVQAWSDGTAARLLKLEVHELKSAWE